MPAFDEEVLEALEEGVELKFLVNPIRVRDEKGMKRLECLRMKLAEKDETGRRRAVPVPDSQFFLEAEQVIIAAGEKVDIAFLPRGIKKKDGMILTHAGGKTLVNGVFAGGDVASRERTVAHAIGQGKGQLWRLIVISKRTTLKRCFHRCWLGRSFGFNLSLSSSRRENPKSPCGHLR